MSFKRLTYIFLVLVLSSCATTEVRSTQKALISEGTLTVYMQPLPQESHRLTFDISEIKALKEDGSEETLVRDVSSIKADQLIGLQKRILSTSLRPGQYRGLSITFKGATLLGEDGESALSVPAEPIIAEQKFTITKRQATTLFLTLMPEWILTDGFRLTPRFSLTKPQRLLISLKGFISNADNNSVTVFDKTQLIAVDTIAMDSKPQGIALDQSRQLLYVALSGSNSIGIIEVNNDAIFGRITLRSGDNPTEIILGQQGQVLLSINPGSYTSSIIDTLSMIETERIKFKSEPADIFRSELNSRAYVLLPDTNSIALIDYSTPRNVEVLTVDLDETPLRGVAGLDNESLYLLTRFSSNLLVLNRETLTVRDRIYIGSGAVDLVEDQSGLIYVARKNGEIAIVNPSVGAVIDAFSVPKGVRYLKIDQDQSTLLVVYPERGAIEKFGLVSRRSLGVLDIGAGAFAVSVMGER